MPRVLLILAALCLLACASAPPPAGGPDAASFPQPAQPAPRRPGGEVEAEMGVASYYAKKFHGRRTASGERYDMNELTAAHLTLPFGTRVRVTNLRNGNSVIVWINDRGPLKPPRIIDVSWRAAEKLDFIRAGLTEVRVELLR